MNSKKMRLGELLLSKGLIDRDQLNSALAFQRQWGHRLGTAMVAQGFLTEQQLVEVLAEALDIEAVDLSVTPIDEEAVQALPYALAVENDLIPIAREPADGARKALLTVAVADPLNLPALDEIEFTYDCRVKPVLAPLTMISTAIRKYYLREDTNIGPPPPPPTDRGAEEGQAAGESPPMTVLRGGQYVDIYDQEPGEPTSPEIVANRAATSNAIPVRTNDVERLDRLQNYIYALLRIMVRKGMISKEEFFTELERDRES